MKDKYKPETYVFIMGQSFPRSEVIKLISIALFLLVALIVGGVLYYLDWRESQSLRAANREQVEAFEEEAALEKVTISPLKQFFEDYLQQTQFDQVDSIRAVGSYQLKQKDMEITFLVKRPGLYRQTLSMDSFLLEFGFDGETVWLTQSREVIDSSNLDLLKLNKLLATLESSIPCLAWSYDPKEPITQYQLMPDALYEGHECYVIKNTELLPGMAVYHYIDKESKFEHYRRASVQIAPRRYKDIELFYDPPLEGSKYPLPSGMELLMDGQISYDVDFDVVEVNRGIASYLFQQSRGAL
jgi:hypothetical protein